MPQASSGGNQKQRIKEMSFFLAICLIRGVGFGYYPAATFGFSGEELGTGGMTL